MRTYAIKLTKDDNGTLLATCPRLPEVTTFGRDVDDALAHAADAVEEAIAARMADREPIPEPSVGRHTVELPAQTAAKVQLNRLMRNR
jgi:antitoxin HicB